MCIRDSSKYLGEAVDAVRKQEHRSLSQAGTSPLAGSKWAWLRKYPDGRSAEAVSFRALNQLNLKTSRAWCIKENFTQFWSCLLYTSDAADDLPCVDLGGRRIIKKKTRAPR